MLAPTSIRRVIAMVAIGMFAALFLASPPASAEPDVAPPGYPSAPSATATAGFTDKNAAWLKPTGRAPAPLAPPPAADDDDGDDESMSAESDSEDDGERGGRGEVVGGGLVHFFCSSFSSNQTPFPPPPVPPP